MKHTTTALAAAAALTLGACAAPPPYDQTAQYPATYPSQYPAQYPSQYPSQYPPPASYPPVVSGYGYVDMVEVLAPPDRQGPSIGAIGGAIAGGVLGNQVGHGAGRAAATIGGALAGGVLGNEIEKRVDRPPQPQQFRYRIRMDDGSYQTFTQDFDAGVRQGDRVRVDNGRVYRA